jgi:broad specificity phosphatase PhoE
MGSIYLLRHGQASFGADNYDQLSDLGTRQCQRLGEYLRERGRRFDAVLTGSLQRHRQSHAALSSGLGDGAIAAPEPEVRDGLNEYDSAAVLATVHDGPLARATTPEQYRHHFRLLRQGLAAWMAGAAKPQGMPSYADFVDGVHQALQRARELQRDGGDVLIVSSGGPISTAVGQVLRTPSEVTIDLNMRLRNSAVCELAITPKRLALVTFNHVPHLDGDAYADWHTHT